MKRSLTMTTAAVLTGLTLFVTACTNSGASDKEKENGNDSASGGSNGSATGADADKALKVRKCLRDHGIDAPDPEPGQDPRGMTLGMGADPQKVEEAMKACGLQGSGAAKEPTQEEKDKELRWIRCMRENGIDIKDPDYSGGMKSAIKIPEGQEKAFEAAQKKCEAS
ncbi:hypothetical protein ABZW32_35165 [Streptomyces sp. NPDC004667]|uniref:hypothetical protein n=1 Tax=Streptomyces sp. NPDC004667 TaxID=3154285 RepID=UPI00339E6537